MACTVAPAGARPAPAVIPAGVSPEELRVVSLIPSATEIACLVGAERNLVGRSHECDFPASVTSLPALTGQKHAFESSEQMDAKVREMLQEGGGLYHLDIETLRALRPHVILTQSLCAVCAVDYALVARAAREMDPHPAVIDLNPQSLDDVFKDAMRVGTALGREEEARRAVEGLRGRVARPVAAAAEQAPPERPRVAFLEWTAPLFVGGHWTPQLIRMAGGSHPLNEAREGGGAGPSFAVEHAALREADPDWVVVCPCGLDLATARRELGPLAREPWWADLRAVRAGRVVLVDGHQMFNRPGPRLVDALAFLVGLLHERCRGLMPRDFPWERL